MVFLGIVFKTRLKYSKELFDYNVKIQKLSLLIIKPIVDSKRYAIHRKDLVPTFLVSKKTKRKGEKAKSLYENRDAIKASTHGAPSSELCEVLRDTYF